MTAAGARRALAGTALFLLVVLVTTGVGLVFTYAPGREQALALTPHPAVAPARLLHRAAALALLPVAAALVTAAIAERGRHRSVLAGGLLLVVLVGALVWTGYRLPWDQLAVSATRTAGRFRGMVTAAFDADVRHVRIDGAEVGQGAFRGRLLVHVAVLPALLTLTGVATARSLRGRRSATGAPPPPTGRSGR